MKTHWPHKDVLENQVGCQKNVYSENGLYLCSVCIVYTHVVVLLMFN